MRRKRQGAGGRKTVEGEESARDNTPQAPCRFASLSALISRARRGPNIVLPANVEEGSRLLDMPKSASLAMMTAPISSSKILAGLMSMWMMSALCTSMR